MECSFVFWEVNGMFFCLLGPNLDMFSMSSMVTARGLLWVSGSSRMSKPAVRDSIPHTNPGNQLLIFICNK